MHSTARRSACARLPQAASRTEGAVPEARRCAWLLGGLAALAAIVSAASETSAAPITDKSFFFGVPSTTIDFETDGSGAPVSLIDGQSLTMPTTAYQSKGVVFSSGVKWVNDGTPSFDAAQSAGGSPNNSIPSSGVGALTITFSTPVYAVGIWIANNFQFDAAGPSMTARDGTNTAIETVSFGNQAGGSIFVDARVGLADHGFMGISSATPIKSITLSKQAAIFDDLIFSTVPSPAPAILFALGVIGQARRRR